MTLGPRVSDRLPVMGPHRHQLLANGTEHCRRPRDNGARVDFRCTRGHFCEPRTFELSGIDIVSPVIEARNQRLGEMRPVLGREIKGLDEKLVRCAGSGTGVTFVRWHEARAQRVTTPFLSQSRLTT